VITRKAKTEYEKVEFLNQKPSRVALRIGLVSTNGNGYSDFDDLIEKAKKEAAKIGGDFILAENSGVEENTVYLPGQSSYNSNANLNWGSSYGYGNSSASGYSTGPSIYTTKSPWSNFSVWIYTPAQLGIRLENGNTVSSFHLNSDAGKAGIKIGDTIVGIDSFDVFDQKAIQHLMAIHPGDKVELTIQRDGKRIERQITALPN
jgi:hypothetical protein